MDIAHLLFYLTMGAGTNLLTPNLPVVGPLAVSAGWHFYRNDYHDVAEYRQETDVVRAGFALGRAVVGWRR